MFDTVRFQDIRKIREDFEGDWEITDTSKKDERGQLISGATARHNTLDLRAFSRDGVYFHTFHIPSLPTLIYGHNGVVISSQRDLDLAVKVADLLFGQICTPIDTMSDRRTYSRADVAIQIRMDYKQLEIAYVNTKQTRASKTTEIHPGESIMLPLSGQNLRFYNKDKQVESKRRNGKKLKFKAPVPYSEWLKDVPGAVDYMESIGYKDPPNDIVRIEVQLEKTKINNFLSDGETRPSDLNLLKGYFALREVLCAIRVNKFPGVQKRKIATFLALVNHRDPELYEIYLNQVVGVDRAKKLRREVSRYMPSLIAESINWEEILPADHPISSPQIHMPGPKFVNFDPNDPQAIHKVDSKPFHPPYPDLVKEARQLLLR